MELSEGTTETSPRPPDETGPSENPWERLSSILVAFRKARIELDASWANFCAERDRNDALHKEAFEQAELASLSVGVARAQLDRQKRNDEISQRPEFVSSYYRQAEAKRTVQNLRSELQIPLGRLAVRYPEAEVVLRQLDRLSPELSPHDVDIIIGLLEEILDRPTTGSADPTDQIAGGLTVEVRDEASYNEMEATGVEPEAKMASSDRASPQRAKSEKKRGRRPNQVRRDAIHNAIRKHGDTWRDHLDELFTELDSQEVVLGDFQGMKIELGDGTSIKASKWDNLGLAEGEQRRQIVDALRKYTD